MNERRRLRINIYKWTEGREINKEKKTNYIYSIEQEERKEGWNVT
jgi:hypothetical protein